ncbi:hypothetical protein OYT00_01910 [Microbacterium paraoxydans]|uniref:hypothetical protein n=1 Tax=Microbacterium paraoxydans TaxID=199592 RepID=UPI00228582CF|nr:hypothetical protein [Microbacterium paraoxydans]MCZ0708742.1 hypothetical protein [Microbacterium paraoxydans]
MTDFPDDLGLDSIFVLDADSWAPRKALFRLAHEALAERGVALTPQRLYRALRARGFRESTRRGVAGFHGFYVVDELAEAPRFVPEHSAASYRRGDRSPEAKRARRRETTPAQRHGAEPLTLADSVLDELTPAHFRRVALDLREMNRSRDERRADRMAARRAAGELEALIDRHYPDDAPAAMLRELRDLRERAGHIAPGQQLATPGTPVGPGR